MKTKLTFLFLGVGLFLTMSCTKYPPSSERLLEDLAVVTQVDVKADFNDYKTYSMPNYIYMVTDKDAAARDEGFVHFSVQIDILLGAVLMDDG